MKDKIDAMHVEEVAAGTDNDLMPLVEKLNAQLHGKSFGEIMPALAYIMVGMYQDINRQAKAAGKTMPDNMRVTGEMIGHIFDIEIYEASEEERAALYKAAKDMSGRKVH